MADTTYPITDTIPGNVAHLRPIMTKPEVLETVGLSYPTVWAMMRRDDFPLSVKLTSGKVGWYRDEVAEWLASRPRSKLKPLASAGQGKAP